ncbi:MAG TPA: Wzz/FepE/Etk N-terminal domain-containing protein [Burkholderiales bacterium]|jgi:chain length determinant protein EpsF|nr:Wzz/FepE/Etk N-terminal domain-containing protein [Burkholderiales bacterium]
MDLNQFLLALRARRKAFALVMAATIVTAIVVSLLVPKRYVATTTLLINGRDEQSMTSENFSPRERLGYLQTQMDLMTSGRVAARVARDLKLAQRPGMRDDFERDTGGVGDINDWIGSNLLRQVKVDNSASNVVTLQYTAPNAKDASEIANGFAKAYQEVSLQLRTEPTREAAAWFEEQLKGLRNNVAQAQTRLTAYQKEKGLIGVDERGDMESTRLSELSTQLLTARNATYEAQSRYKSAAEVIQNGGAAESIPEIMSNAAIATAKADLARATSNLEQLANDLGPNHPAFIRAQGEVQAARERLQSETKKVVSGLQNAVLQNQKRETELKNALAAQQERLVTMRDARVQMAVLTRDVESAQRAYDTALTRYMTNKVDSAARTMSASQLTPAAQPLAPKYPNVPLISALSVLIGALFAAGVVFLLETMDRRVRSRSDLESRLAVPILGRLSKWQPAGGRLLPAPARPAHALPHPW